MCAVIIVIIIIIIIIIIIFCTFSTLYVCVGKSNIQMTSLLLIIFEHRHGRN